MKQTITCCEQKIYIEKGVSVTLKDPSILPASEFYDHFNEKTKFENEEFYLNKSKERCIITELCIYNGDCLEMAIKLKNLGYNPAVLNMTSEKSPGGGYKYGAGAQEETLFRRSNYYQILATPEIKSQRYPLKPFIGIYSPAVTIFRDTEEKGYAFLSSPVDMSFIAMSAYNKPPLQDNRLLPETAEYTKQKIRIILHIALVNHHDSIVLSALGCGAYKNPPRHMAELFKEVLQEDLFRGKFKVMVFAIFDDFNAHKEHNPEGNFRPFLETLGTIGNDYRIVQENEISSNLKTQSYSICSIMMDDPRDPDNPTNQNLSNNSHNPQPRPFLGFQSNKPNCLNDTIEIIGSITKNRLSIIIIYFKSKSLESRTIV
jgi:uncharacterized protein (TIGR02452 family)